MIELVVIWIEMDSSWRWSGTRNRGRLQVNGRARLANDLEDSAGQRKPVTSIHQSSLLHPLFMGNVLVPLPSLSR